MTENHIGMKQIGQMVNIGDGKHSEDLTTFKENMERIGCNCDIIKLDLVDDAFVLIIRNDVSKILENLFREQINLNTGKRSFMYVIVVNKHSRWNLFQTMKMERVQLLGMM